MPSLADLFVDLSLRDRAAVVALGQFQRKLTQVNQTKVQPKITLPDVNPQIRALNTKLAALSKNQLKLGIDKATIDADVATLRKQLATLTSRQATIPLHLRDQLAGEIKSVETELAQATSRQRTIPLKVERVDARIAAVRHQLDTLHADVPVQLDRRHQLAGQLRGMTSAIGRAVSSSSATVAGVGTEIGSKFGGKFAGAVKGVAGPAVALGLGVTLVKGFSGAIDKASQFDSTMRTVGVNVGAAGVQLKQMTALALDMGAKTSFSAQGAADAMLALAKGGLTQAQIKAGALHETLTLASAGGLELGNAADYMVQGLNSFGLQAKDAGRVAAALAGGANASTASVESMGLALSQVGAGAKTAGLSIEDTTAALAAFDSAGIKGSDAGTSLKTMLTRLVPSTKQARSEMKDLGLITKDGSNAFFDAKGNIENITVVAGKLQEALKGQSKEQKIATLNTIFGSDASRAAAVLADQGAAGLAKFVKATSDKAAADKLAKTATEGYAGALERFRGSAETAGIQFGTKLLPVLSKGLDLLSGRFLPAMTGLGSAVSPVVGAFARITGVVGKTFIRALTGGKSAVKGLTDFLETHQEAMVGTFVMGAKAVLSLGKTLATMASSSLRSLAFLSDAYAGLTTVMLAGMGALAHGVAEVWGFLPGLGPKLKAADKAFAEFAKTAATGMRGVGPKAREAADAIDHKVVPAIDKARTSLDKIGDVEIAKAKFRDTAARAAQAVRDIGTKADGSQLKLRKFSDTTRLSAGEQAGLRSRLAAASGALREQLTAANRAGVGQAKLTQTWETGRKRLYDEFRQMGLSRAEAGRLASKYAGIKPKVSTKFEQPGMKGAKDDADRYRSKVRAIPTKWTTTATLTFKNNAGKIVTNLNKSFQLVKGGPRLSYAVGGVMPGYTPGRDVHRFYSSTGGELDLSGGEAVMRPEWTKAVGGPKVIKQWNQDAKAGKLRMASGGVLGQTSAGIPATSREGTNGSQMYGWAVKKKLEGAMKYARTTGGPGGPIAGGGYARALAYARAHAGHPYIFGSLWDCSGFMSALHSIILGQQPHRRYSTPAFHGAHAQGFTRGKRSPFMVGVRPLSGKLGHMAGTLNGVNVESAGGVGVRLGKSARGWNNSMFSWRGGLANGGVIGDLPFDTLDPRGERYDPRLRKRLEEAAAADPLLANAIPQLANGAIVRGGRGGVLAHVGEGQHDELVMPLPKQRTARAGGGDMVEAVNRLIATIEARGLTGTQVSFGDVVVEHGSEAQGVNRRLQRAGLGLV